MPEFRLDSFEKDESNKFALALLGAVVQLQQGYSPLFIHGEDGSGKTHLLSALNTELALAHPEISMLYIPEDFPIDKLLLGEGDSSNGGSDEFIYKAFSRKDVLIVDDIERFSADPKIKDRFYSLFDVFIDNAKQIVVASSRPIEELKGFNERFRSRLRGGIDAHVRPPEPESRLRILKRECDRAGLKLNVEMLQLLMKEAGKDINYLKKLPAHIKTFSSLNRQELTANKLGEFLAVIRAETSRDEGEATAEEVYGSWVQAQAKKREDKLTKRVQELEQRLSEQVQKANDLSDDLETMRSVAQSADGKSFEIVNETQKLRQELKETDGRLKTQEKEAAKEIAGLTKELEQRDRHIEKLKTDHEQELAKANSRLEEEILSIRIKLEDKEESLKVLSEEREMRSDQHEKEKAELEGQRAELQNQCLFLERTVEDLNERIKEFEAIVEQSAGELASRDSSIEELRASRDAELSELKKEVSEKEQALAAASEREAELRNEIEGLFAERDGLRERASSLQNSASDLTGQVGERDAEIAAKASEIEELNASVAGFQSELEARDRRLEEIERELSEQVAGLSNDLQQRNESLQKAESELNERAAHLESARQETEQANAEIARLSEELSSLRQEKDGVFNDLADARRELEERLQERNKLAAHVEAQHNEIAGLKSEHEEMSASLKEQVKEAMKELVRVREAAGENIKKLQKQAKDQQKALHEQIEELSSERDKLKERTASLGNAISDLNGKVEEREKALAAQDAELKKLNASVTGLQSRLHDRERQIEQIGQEESEQLAGLREELEQRTEVLHKAESDLSERTAQLEASMQEAEKANAEAAQLSAKLATLHEEKENSEKHLSSNIKELSESLAAAEGQVSELQNKLAKAEKVASRATRDLEQVRESSAGELQAAQGKSVELKTALSQAETASQEALHQASAEIEQLRATLSQLEEQNKDLSEKGKGAEEHISGLTQELEQHRAEVQRLSKELARRDSEIESKSDATAKQGNRLSSLEDELKAAFEQIEKLKTDAKADDKKLKQQEKLLRKAKEDASRSVKLTKEKDRHIADLQRNLESMRKNLAKKVSGDDGGKKFSPLEAELSEKEKMLASVRLDYAELQADYKSLKDRTSGADKKITELESLKAKMEEELESVRRGPSKDQLLSRIEELEALVEEKDRAEQLSKTLSDEMEKLKASHEKAAQELKDQVKEAMKEIERVRSASEEQVREHRDEAAVLRERLARWESGTGVEDLPPLPKIETRKEISEEVEIIEPEMEERFEFADADVELCESIREEARQAVWTGDFESFLTSEANAFSVSMAEKISRNPGELYNPLCIYGPPGSGKTHILHAIGDLSTSEDPELVCALLSVDSLVEVAQADEATIAAWLATVRILVIDDFQIANVAPEVQHKIYEFLSAMAERGAQIVTASEEPPIRMNYLQEYFIHFLEGGLLAKLEAHPDIEKEQKKTAEAIAAAAKGIVAPPEAKTEPSAALETEPKAEMAGVEDEELATEPPKDFLDEFITPNPTLTDANFRGKRVFVDFEEAFKYPNKKWRNKFPLLVLEDDDERRKHFFHALANNLTNIFDGPVSLLSMDELAEMLALTPSVDWNGLLNKLARSSVVLINDCESVIQLPESAAGYMQAIVEDITKRDILLMVGMSKRYKKEPIFGTVFKKASRKKI